MAPIMRIKMVQDKAFLVSGSMLGSILENMSERMSRSISRSMSRSLSGSISWVMVWVMLCVVSCVMLQAVTIHAVWAEELKVDLVVQRVQEWYDRVCDLQADFRQKSFSQTLNTTTEARGKIYFKKPNLMKWDYESPEKQIYVINREDFWWYVPDDAQVVKRKASTVLEDTTPLSFLAGLGNLQKSYITSLPEGIKPADSQVILLNLIPRKARANIKKLQLKLEAKTYGISGIVLVDPYGNKNDIDFIHIQLNQGLKDKTFHFVPPKGVDVVDGELQNVEVPLNPLGH